MRYYLAVLCVIGACALPWALDSYPVAYQQLISTLETAGLQYAAVILAHNPKTVATIQSRYVPDVTATTTKVRILIVPGHEPGFGGAEFGSTKERELTVLLADDLKHFLDTDSHFYSVETRTNTEWNPEFATYFKNSWDDILAWEKASRKEMSQLIKVGVKKPLVATVYHNVAPSGVANRLFGITKWANEHDIDITIHIHFNDSPDHIAGTKGTHTGFTIYVPTSQYSNSTTTKVVADTIFKRLSKYNAVSDLEGESKGVVEDPDLIAVGASNTADSASMLIEYGYIYEPQFTDTSVRDSAIKDLAFQTYLGLQDFFGTHPALFSAGYDTLMLPYHWDVSSAMSTDSQSVLALQTALRIAGNYPPQHKSMNDCPRSGSFGPCTKTALKEFQQKHTITGEEGIIGPRTRDALNEEYSAHMI